MYVYLKRARKCFCCNDAKPIKIVLISFAITISIFLIVRQTVYYFVPLSCRPTFPIRITYVNFAIQEGKKR